MAIPTYPATNNQEAVDLNILNSNTFHIVVNGGITDEADTYEGNGKIPSVLKAINTMATYKAPIAWVDGGTETDILQPRLFGDFVFVPINVPAPMGSIPSDTNWKLYFQSVDSSLQDTGQNYYREEVLSTKNTFSVDFDMQQFSLDGVDKPQITVFIHKDGVSRKVDVDDLNWISLNSFSISYSVLAGSVVEVFSETIASFTLISAIRDEAQGYADAAQISATAAAASALEADGYADAAAASAVSAASSAASAASAATDAVNAALSDVEADISSLETSVTTLESDALKSLSVLRVAQFMDIKDKATAGGSCTPGAWNARTLNTTILNTITGCVLNGDSTISLPAGDYYIEADAPCFAGNQHMLAVRKVGDTTATGFLLLGGNEYSTGSAQNKATVSGKISFAVSGGIYLSHWIASNAGSTQSLGVQMGAASDKDSRYSHIKIWEVS